MNDDTKKAYDLFGLTEIDKIQDEIERDLAASATSTAEQALEQGGDSAIYSPNFLLIDPPVMPALPSDPIPDNTEGFYREMIKEAPRRARGSWLRRVAAILLVCTIGTGTLGFGMGAGWSYFQGRSGNGVNNMAPGSIPEPMSLTTHSYVFETVTTEEVGSIADMVELLVPAVVSVTTRRTEERRRDFRPNLPPVSAGSGIIFAECEERIFIATSIYVTLGGSRFDISIAGSRPISATPVGRDLHVETAVLSIYKTQLIDAGIDSVVIASFGDSGEMRVGDAVFAIGNAMDDGISVTSGVISATQRYIEFPNRQQPSMILQTDAAINYGNSGGPLINTRGEIIGININQATALIFGYSNVEGMGYSIASSAVVPVLEEIITAPPTPGIGITGDDVSEEVAMRLGIPMLGVYVTSVVEGRGAERAGILEGDVITGINGYPVFDMPQLQGIIRAGEIGDVVEINIIRSSAMALTLRVELGALAVMF